MRRPAPEGPCPRLSGASARIIPAVLLALAPKCVLCVLTYAGMGAALGLGGPEICGAATSADGPASAWMVAIGLMLGLAGGLVRQVGK